MPRTEIDRVGKFELIALLGEGGMAHVYLALFRGPGGFTKLGVIKRIRPELAHNRDFVTMFLHEARLAALLNHPNVVQTYQVVEEADGYGLAMEYLEGQPLSEIFRRVGRRAMPPEEHLWILSQVLAGLQHAHTLRDYDGRALCIVHRDVNPANVFVTYDGDVKVLDFGIAKVRDSSVVTKRGTLKGKLGYCAPEQIEGLRVDARADVFAVGVMLWEALAGKRMARGNSVPEICQARASGSETKIRKVCPDLPPALIAMCDRATALKPEDRYATAAEFVADIDAYLHKSTRRVARAEIAALLQREFDEDRQFLRRRVEAKLTHPQDPLSRSVTTRPRELVTQVDPLAAKNAPAREPLPGRLLGATALVAAAALALALWGPGRVLQREGLASMPHPPDAAAASRPSATMAGAPVPSKAPPRVEMPDLALGKAILPPVDEASRRQPGLVHLRGWWRAEQVEPAPRKTAPTPVVRRAAKPHKLMVKDRRIARVERIHDAPRASRAELPTADARLADKNAGVPGRQDDEPGNVLSRTGNRRSRQHIDEEDPYHP